MNAVSPVSGFNLSGILNVSHQNKWVAIAPDYSRVIGSAETLQALMRSIKDPRAVYHRVLPNDVSFAPVVSSK